ncbi:MAG: hypothetical protein R3220_12620 [Balneolaceae bacterium]|nr:hypothetical protein [Balneolaceae bacterium]
MKWIKAIISGILATLAMDIAMKGMMLLTGLAPTNIHPAAAFLYNLGIENQFLTSLLHYSYGTFWGVVFVYAFEEEISIKRGLQLAGVLWLFMMIVYSPVIGWGLFGFGDAKLLDPGHPLYLSTTTGYLLITFTVHMAYGFVLGLLTSRLISHQGNLR